MPNKPDKHNVTKAVSRHPPALNVSHTAQHTLRDLAMLNVQFQHTFVSTATVTVQLLSSMQHSHAGSTWLFLNLVHLKLYFLLQ